MNSWNILKYYTAITFNFVYVYKIGHPVSYICSNYIFRNGHCVYTYLSLYITYLHLKEHARPAMPVSVCIPLHNIAL